MNRYDIALGKKPPERDIISRALSARTSVSHTVSYNGHEVRLTSFRVEIARARRVCTNCRSSIPIKQPCVKAKIIATQIEYTSSGKMWRWGEMIQLCPQCIEYMSKYHAKFKGSQTQAQLSNVRIDLNTKYQEYLSHMPRPSDDWDQIGNRTGKRGEKNG